MQNNEFVLFQVLNCYYELNMTLEEISKQFNISKSTLSRIINSAKSDNLVKTHISFPQWFNTKKQNVLMKYFPDVHIIVTDCNVNDAKQQYRYLVNVFSASFVENHLNNDLSITVTGSKTLKDVASRIVPLNKKEGLKWIPMLGGLNPIYSDYSAADICRAFSNVCGGESYLLNAPAILDNDLVYDYLKKLPMIKDVLEASSCADIALTGIGTTNKFYAHVSEDFFNKQDEEFIKKSGAVGNISGRFYNINGEPIEYFMDKSIIGLELSEIKKIKTTISIASDIKKKKSIIGALRGGYIDILYLDSITATAVINELSL